MISSAAASNSLLNFLNTQTTQAGGATDSREPAAVSSTAAVKARVAATSQAALATAGGTYQAAAAGRTLYKQQATLASDMRAAMGKSGVKLGGSVEFSVSSDGKVAVTASESDKTAITAFLKSDSSRPGFAARIATQARDALKVAATIQQSAAISQAARYGGHSGGVMSLYTSLMQQANTHAAVFTFSASASALSYPGSLATHA